MKGLARSGSGDETTAVSPLPTIAIGGRGRMPSGRAANDNRQRIWRRVLPPLVFVASLILLLLSI